MKSLQEAITHLRNEGCEAGLGLILGTGLSGMVGAMRIHKKFPYDSLPGFVQSTVESHAGVLLFGEIQGKTVLAMQGRFHLYEGYLPEEVVFPVQVMAGLGVKTLLVSNAAGALNPNYRKGELMLIGKHIDFQDSAQPVAESLEPGLHQPEMYAPYDTALIEKLLTIAAAAGITIHRGCYVAVTGPMLETRAEYRYLRRLGADAVGMSTVPEIMAAEALGLRTMAVSVLTDECDPDHLQPVTLEEIIRVAGEADGRLSTLLTQFIASL